MAYPSGLSATLFALGGGGGARATTRFLLLLALPFALVALAVAALRPELLALRASPPALLVAAVVAAPLALGLEFAVHALAVYRASGAWPRGLELDRFWSGGLGALDHLLLAAVVVGEEIVYRQLWIGALVEGFGAAAAVALAVSAIAYGLNHLAFGALSVLSKTLAGLIYGGLFLASGGSLWPPLVAHALHNLLIFALSGRGDG